MTSDPVYLVGGEQPRDLDHALAERDALLRASASAALHHASVLVTPPAAK